MAEGTKHLLKQFLLHVKVLCVMLVRLFLLEMHCKAFSINNPLNGPSNKNIPNTIYDANMKKILFTFCFKNLSAIHDGILVKMFIK